jgi:hypothetical protein
MTRRGDLLAYTDDFLFLSSSIVDIGKAIQELDKLVDSYGIVLNRRKC